MPRTEPKAWERRRYVTLAIVVAGHAGVVALLLRPVMERRGAPAPQAIQIVFVASAPNPRIRSESFRPLRLSGDAVRSLAPPSLDTGTASEPAAGAEGRGTGVDWSAEARRALHAFEIRSSRRGGNEAGASVTDRDAWWPRVRHHAGEQYKNAAGDWIVWVTANCFQIAAAAAPASAIPHTECVAPEHGGRDDSHH